MSLIHIKPSQVVGVISCVLTLCSSDLLRLIGISLLRCGFAVSNQVAVTRRIKRPARKTTFWMTGSLFLSFFFRGAYAAKRLTSGTQEKLNLLLRNYKFIRDGKKRFFNHLCFVFIKQFYMVLAAARASANG